MARRRIGKLGKLILLLLLGIGGGLALLLPLSAPYGEFGAEVLVDIPRGSGTLKIAELLADARVIRSPWYFTAVRAMRPRAALQAGEYRFSQPASVFGVFDRLARGDIFFYEVTIPEGSNLFDIGELLEEKRLIAAEDFRKTAMNPGLIRDLAPKAPSLEGFLFPATYRLTKHTTAVQLCENMTGRFRRAWKALNGPSKDVLRLVTLASLVEKETAVAEERPMVSSVFVNRLERGIKLDCDPTVIYAALREGRYRGKIFRSDLDHTNPYNTYQHAGLPPGPIANPGTKALEAALRPAQTDYIFFVAKADGSGGHVFSAGIEAHNRAVAEYRRGQQK
ncbi:MAG TPA: endolytic transglycosylase MltG [Bryobacteraceae bacterium]|nr:endolytic transglycosylase MltG [Bryobacteraceae bacterium]